MKHLHGRLRPHALHWYHFFWHCRARFVPCRLSLSLKGEPACRVSESESEGLSLSLGLGGGPDLLGMAAVTVACPATVGTGRPVVETVHL